MSTFTRPSLRTASLAAATAGAAYYAGHTYSSRASMLSTAYAEDAKSGPKKIFPGSGFTELKLESAEMVNHNVKKLRFALPDKDAVSGLAPVSSLLTKHTPDGGWIPVFRPYTPVSDNDDPGHVTFMVKKYPNGKASGKMHSLVPGDSMSFKQLHELDYKPNQFSAMTFIVGGSGITPIYQLTRSILRNPADKTKIALVYANNTEQDILLKSEFDALSNEYPGRFSATYTVSKTSSEGEGLYHVGYVTKDMLVKVLPKDTGKGAKILVSGPPNMTEAIAGKKGFFGWTQGSMGGILGELGYTKEQVHKF